MGTKTFTKIDKKGHEEIWTWDETPELLKFRQQQERMRVQDAALNYDTESK